MHKSHKNKELTNTKYKKFHFKKSFNQKAWPSAKFIRKDKMKQYTEK